MPEKKKKKVSLNYKPSTSKKKYNFSGGLSGKVDISRKRFSASGGGGVEISKELPKGRRLGVNLSAGGGTDGKRGGGGVNASVKYTVPIKSKKPRRPEPKTSKLSTKK